jgi:hypothetical protein
MCSPRRCLLKGGLKGDRPRRDPRRIVMGS